MNQIKVIEKTDAAEFESAVNLELMRLSSLSSGDPIYYVTETSYKAIIQYKDNTRNSDGTRRYHCTDCRLFEEEPDTLVGTCHFFGMMCRKDKPTHKCKHFENIYEEAE